MTRGLGCIPGSTQLLHRRPVADPAGVTIGDSCIVGAGSVVTRSVPSNCVVVAGNPPACSIAVCRAAIFRAASTLPIAHPAVLPSARRAGPAAPALGLGLGPGLAAWLTGAYAPDPPAAAHREVALCLPRALRIVALGTSLTCNGGWPDKLAALSPPARAGRGRRAHRQGSAPIRTGAWRRPIASWQPGPTGPRRIRRRQRADLTDGLEYRARRCQPPRARRGDPRRRARDAARAA